MIVFKWMVFIVLVFEMAGQTKPAVSIQVHPQVAGRSIRDGQVTTVYLAPRYATAIRMPEAINSVVVGDPGSFSAEHSDREPQLVFVKPITPKPAQTNLLISTTRGLQVSLLLVSRGEPKGDQEADIDFLMRYKPISPIQHPASGESLSRCPPDCHPYQRCVSIGSDEGLRRGRVYRAQIRRLRKRRCHPTAGCQYDQGGTDCSR